MSDGGQSNTVIDTSQTNVDPNTAVNPNPGSVDTTDYNPTTVSQWWDTQQAVGGTPNFSTFPFGQAANAILGGSGGGMGAGLALGLGALAAALSRQQAPEIKHLYRPAGFHRDGLPNCSYRRETRRPYGRYHGAWRTNYSRMPHCFDRLMMA